VTWSTPRADFGLSEEKSGPGGLRSWVPLTAWGVFVVVLAGAHLAVPTGRWATTTYLAAVVGAGALAWLAWPRQRLEDRRAAALVAAGLSANAIADVLYEIITAVEGGPPDLSVADVFYLLSYVLLVAGILGPLRTELGHRVMDVDGLIDLASFMVIALLLVGDLMGLGAILEDGTEPFATRLVWAAYPVLDAALLAVLVRAIVIGRMHGRVGVIMFVGVACWLAADVGFALDADGELMRWQNVGWMVGASALAAAVATPSTDRAAFDGQVRPVRTGRILINLLPLLLPWAVELESWWHGGEVNPVPLALATFALLACAALRATRLARARDEHQTRLIEREHYYRVLANNSSDAVVVIDRAGRLVHECPPMAATFGLPELAQPGGDLLTLLPDAERARMEASLAWLWETPEARSEADVEVTDAKGRTHWFHLRAANLRHDPSIGAIVVNFSNITGRKRAEQELAHHAFHDTLTGLPNRALFRDRVDHALRLRSTSRGGVAVIFLDLDGFKNANDRFGHATGDELLRAVAARLSGCLRGADTVARLGGDEFAILIEAAADPLADAVTTADRVLQAMAPSFVIEEQCLTLSASLGVAVADDESDQATLLRDADIAMYRSKSGGKKRWTVYDDAMRAAAIERMELELDLQIAVDRGQLRLAYHPIVRLDTETVTGFEALLRWDHPTRGEVGPATFIPIAEATGAILPIGDWVIEEACRTAARWRAAYPAVSTTMGVNVSARQLADPDIVARIAAALDRHGLDAHMLVVEMTESVLIEDAEAAAARLGELRRLGVRLAIDDFGTGYSSLSYLRQFEIDILKIDSSFVSSITDCTQVPAIVRGLLDLGRTLALETVAEGIEDDNQLVSLRRERCEFGQGFLFTQPLCRDDAEQLVAQLARESANV
jgi:diguanylate cyclase (GGDEF)-like protein/PAS domain S-box-containing protein